MKKFLRWVPVAEGLVVTESPARQYWIEDLAMIEGKEYRGNFLRCSFVLRMLGGDVSFSLSKFGVTGKCLFIYTNYSDLPDRFKHNDFTRLNHLLHVSNTLNLSKEYCQFLVELGYIISRSIVKPEPLTALLDGIVFIAKQLNDWLQENQSEHFLNLDFYLQEKAHTLDDTDLMKLKNSLEMIDYLTHTEVMMLYHIFSRGLKFDPTNILRMDFIIHSYRNVCDTCSAHLLAFLLAIQFNLPMDLIQIWAESEIPTGHSQLLFSGVTFFYNLMDPFVNLYSHLDTNTRELVVMDI